MPSNGVLAIDGDGHVMEPPDLWSDRMDERRWGDWIPRTDPATGVRYVGGQIRMGAEDGLRRAAARSGVPYVERSAGVHQGGAAPKRLGGYDPEVRLRDMDRAGIDVSVLYPSRAMFFGPSDPIDALSDVQFVADCQRAYNEWLAEFCATDQARLFGIGLVPLQDVDLAVAEARRAVDAGLRGVMVRPSPYIDELPFSHHIYDPFWAACEELGIPVSFHPRVHADTPGACRKFHLVVDDPDITVVNNTVTNVYGGSGLGQAIGNAADMIVTVGRLIMGGVCERFPGLRMIFLESGGGWMPTILERMDEQVEEFPLDGANLRMLPSEYFRRQCYVSFECEEWNLVAAARWLGTDRVLWASDYPHPEYHDTVVSDLSERLEELPVEDRRRIIFENAVDAYALPLPVGR